MHVTFERVFFSLEKMGVIKKNGFFFIEKKPVIVTSEY